MSRSGALPPGVCPGGLGARFVAFMIDVLLPTAVGGGATALLVGLRPERPAALATSMTAAVLIVAWLLACWWSLARRGGTPGMKVVGLQFVGIEDGRAVGYLRALLRQVVLIVLVSTVIGALAVIVAIVMNPRRQGWHDTAGHGVVIRQRIAPPPAVTASPAPAPAIVPGMIGESEPGEFTNLRPIWAEQTLHPYREDPSAAAWADAQGADDAVVASAPGAVWDPEATHIAAPTRPWTLTLDDGRQFDIAELVLLGRNPHPGPTEQHAELVTVPDPDRLLSKTHLAVGAGPGGVWVCDRGSTNGSALLISEADFVPLSPGERVPVGDGQVISVGSRRLEITARSVRSDAGR